jgi:hypothetical protein
MRTSDWDDPEIRAIGTSAQTQPSFSGLNPIRGVHGTSQSQ